MPQSASQEQPIQISYPSIASLKAGRALGVLYESIPVYIGGLKLSHLLFPLPTAPIAALLYVGLKIGGRRHILTTHRLQTTRGLRQTLLAEIPLDEIARMEIASTLGQHFYKAGDLIIRDHQGLERLRLEGIPHPHMLRQTILDARDALTTTEAAQRTIAARHAVAGGGEKY